MEIESTPLFREAQEIMQGGATNANVSWSTVIHCSPTVGNLSPLLTLSVNIQRDYAKAFADIRTLSVLMGLGDYARLVYPNRVGLEITLTRTPLYEISSDVAADKGIESERYSAMLLDGPVAPTVGQGAESTDQEAMNLSQLVEVHFQLLDKTVEQVRVMLTGGPMRTCRVEEVIKTTLTRQATQVVVSNQKALLGVDMVPADNQDVKGQVVITHGTRLVDVPDYLQKRVGVYNAGLGSYLQNLLWYVFPLYNTAGFNSRKKTLTILVLPKRKFHQIERSYTQRGDSLVIIGTGETGFKDSSGTDYVASGNGMRYADAATLLDGGITVANNKATLRRNHNNSEYITGEASNGIDYAPLSRRRITANPFVDLSFLASKNGGVFTCQWYNADPALIIPGMATKVVYSDGEQVKQIYGTVHAHEHVSHRSTGFASDRFEAVSLLQVFVNGQITDIDT